MAFHFPFSFLYSHFCSVISDIYIFISNKHSRMPLAPLWFYFWLEASKVSLSHFDLIASHITASSKQLRIASVGISFLAWREDRRMASYLVQRPLSPNSPEATWIMPMLWSILWLKWLFRTRLRQCSSVWVPRTVLTRGSQERLSAEHDASP